MITSVNHDNITVESDFKPSYEVMFELANDTNCKRSYMGKTLEEVVTPDSTFYRIRLGETSIGVFLLDKVDEKTGAVCIHILITEGYPRITALTATKLAAFHARLRGLIPYTTVSTDPKYDYMRKFLADCGFVHHTYQEDIEIITIPTHYVPNLPLITIHNDGN